jgi:hypothetical protein
MEEYKVKGLWKTLLFVNDFMKALEDQCKTMQEKMHLELQILMKRMMRV